MIGDQRTALFIVISDTDDTFNFVVAMMYSQLFNLLCDRADDVHHGRLPYHVRILCDEFANIGQIPKFDKLIATIRSREISASIILQSQSQLKTIYKDAAETITGNCDTMLFLGGKESTTLKEISETLGKETIDLYNTSDIDIEYEWYLQGVKQRIPISGKFTNEATDGHNVADCEDSIYLAQIVDRVCC